MARPRKDAKDLRERLHVTLSPGLKGRYQALCATTGLDLSAIVERALLRAVEDYERDPGEILRQGSTSGPPTTE